MAISSSDPRNPAQPAEERGERLTTGLAIARGGKETGPVPGATAGAPPGLVEVTEAVKTEAVADALVRLGEDAEPERVVESVKARTGIDLEPGEVTRIVAALRARSRTPPPLDQPPPENARRPPPGAYPR